VSTSLITIAFAALAIVPSVCPGQQVSLRHYTVDDGLAHNTVTRVFQDSRGYIWFATADGLSRFDGQQFVTFRAADGLPRAMLAAIGETHGTLWAAARDGTAVRLNDRALEPRFPALGLPLPADTRILTRVSSRFRDDAQPHHALRTVPRRVFELRRGDSDPLIVRGTSAVVTDAIEDRTGRIWIATSGSGVFAIPPEPIVNYSAIDELPDEHVVRVVESRDGRVYAITRRGGVAELKEDAVEAVPGSLFAPFHTIGRRIAQDEHGLWWFRTDAGLFSAPGPALSFSHARRVIGPATPPPDGGGASLVDSRGWLWEARRGGGVSRCRDHPAARAGCLDFTKADGIGHVVTAIAEDTFGRVYFGTTRGLVRLDADTGTFQAIPPGGGLAGSSITDCMRDSRGRMWIATTTGVSVIAPRRPRAARAPQVYLTGVHAAGTAVVVPPRGVTSLPLVHVGHGAGTLRLEYAAPGFDGDGTLRYQHRLSPVDGAWSGPGSERSVAYSRLSPGTYTFLVRAVAPDGAGGAAATLELTVARPFWGRWWWLFGSIAALLLFAGRSLRELQRAHRGGDLSGVPLAVLGRMEQQSENRSGHRGPADGSRLGQR
jgi:ligand-binding sensor domain-containing protein